MTTANTTAPRWAVSGRTHGEVLTAGVSAPGLEIVLLGVPSGFTPPEVEGWLQDLSGVAVETSRGDTRERPIPAILHHALTGLLFSQAELWGRAEGAAPCSAAFVEAGNQCAFSWVGEAVVQVLVDGMLIEPRWVVVRDEEGREAHAAVFHSGQHVMMSLDYWPQGDRGAQAPASVEAEWAPERPVEAQYAPALDESVTASAPGEPAAMQDAPVEQEVAALPLANANVAAELPEHLAKADQPGLAPREVVANVAPPQLAGELDADEVAALSAVAATESTGESGAETVARIEEGVVPATEVNVASESVEAGEPADAAANPPGAHPVGRWLSRMLGWGKRDVPVATPAPAPETDATPLSSYDSLLSAAATPAADSSEQTHLDLAPEQPAGSLSDLQPLEFVPEQSEFAAEYAGTFVTEYETDFHAAPAVPAVVDGLPEPAADLSAAAGESPLDETFVIEPIEFAAPSAPPPVAAAPDAPDAPDAPGVNVATNAEPAAAVSPPAMRGIAPAGLADVLGAAFARPAPQPEPAPEPEPPAFTHHDLLRALSESPLAASVAPAAAVPEVVSVANVPDAAPAAGIAPLRVDHEPVGAAEDFAIAPVPGMSAPPLVAPEPMLAPPVLHVKLTPYTPAPEAEASAEAPAAPAISGPPTLHAPESPPVLHVNVSETAATPPVLRVDLPGEIPTGPPVLRVEPQPLPPPVIVPTPPVAPVVPAAGFAPSLSGEPAVTTAEADVPAAPPRLPWPVFDELTLEAKRPWYRRPQVLGAIIVALFGAGWLLGSLANPRGDEPGAATKLLRAVGLGGARFDLAVDSSPGGAWIAVDGKDVAKRTPARLELKPGKHTVTLTLPELGGTTVEVNGENGQRLSVNPSLNGALEIVPADASLPISVSVDGRPQGYAPITMESLAPGLHEVQFSGPGMAPWAQTVQVGVGKTEQMIARPMTAPGTGVLQVNATLNDETGSSPLSGAQVFVDGESRGVTPLSLELPRGPHSIRLTWHGETAAVQVIDLPGGNQRFATFAFGLDSASPQVTIPNAPRVMSATQTNMISAALAGLSAREVREAWLHVRSAEGLWRRYAMTPVTGPGVTMMAAVFPPGVFDAGGRTLWYVSATTAQGDEYFSEMQAATLEGTARAARPAAKPAAKPAATP